MGDIVELSDRRAPVIYTVVISSGWDGSFAMEVHDVSYDERSMRSVANDLLRAACLVEMAAGEYERSQNEI